MVETLHLYYSVDVVANIVFFSSHFVIIIIIIIFHLLLPKCILIKACYK